MRRRFGAHPVEAGPFKGGLHIATNRYMNFRGELEYLNTYLNNRLLPTETGRTRNARHPYKSAKSVGT
jgi:hypothetical protein